MVHGIEVRRASAPFELPEGRGLLHARGQRAHDPRRRVRGPARPAGEAHDPGRAGAAHRAAGGVPRRGAAQARRSTAAAAATCPRSATPSTTSRPGRCPTPTGSRPTRREEAVSAGEPLAVPPAVRGSVVGGRANTAYLFDPRTLGSTRLALALLREDSRWRWPAGRSPPAGATGRPGTFVVRRERNPDAAARAAGRAGRGAGRGGGGGEHRLDGQGTGPRDPPPSTR